MLTVATCKMLGCVSVRLTQGVHRRYIWLSFAKEDVLPLNQWVFNTEAHPLRIVQQQWPQPGLKRPVKADKYK